MTPQQVLVRATTTALATAVIALVALLVSVVVDSADGASVAARVGLACLFAVPVVRNVAVVAFGAGRDRVLAGVGIVVVLGVAAASAARVARAGAVDNAAALDQSSPDLRTSDHD